mmetsp:Transcript_72751/g.224722  ORF Transcript_72751/g.224722 Transcript_72751/m.224722 type:complete len:201 (+) Transcript_72751:86-688(+)
MPKMSLFPRPAKFLVLQRVPSGLEKRTSLHEAHGASLFIVPKSSWTVDLFHLSANAFCWDLIIRVHNKYGASRSSRGIPYLRRTGENAPTAPLAIASPASWPNLTTRGKLSAALESMLTTIQSEMLVSEMRAPSFNCCRSIPVDSENHVTCLSATSDRPTRCTQRRIWEWPRAMKRNRTRIVTLRVPRKMNRQAFCAWTL